MKKKPAPEPLRHPDDIAAEAEGVAYGKAHGAEFFRAHQHKFAALVSVYSDAAASDLLDGLRERFWARSWVPNKRTKAQVKRGAKT